MAYGNTFMRSEMKFLLSETDYAALRNSFSGYVTEESFGKHTVCNIYCDTDDWRLVGNSLEKPVYREKLRLRTYGTASDDSPAFLEIKKKFKGVVYKRRAELVYKEALAYIRGESRPEKDCQVLRETDYMIKRLGLKPKIVICYDRRGFYANDDRELRITFDGNIRSRLTELDLRAGDKGEYLAGQPFRVMEIKVAHSVPLWMTHILSELGIYQGAFSKYGSIYRSGFEKFDNRGNELCSGVL